MRFVQVQLRFFRSFYMHFSFTTKQHEIIFFFSSQNIIQTPVYRIKRFSFCDILYANVGNFATSITYSYFAHFMQLPYSLLALSNSLYDQERTILSCYDRFAASIYICACKLDSSQREVSESRNKLFLRQLKASFDCY